MFGGKLHRDRVGDVLASVRVRGCERVCALVSRIMANDYWKLMSGDSGWVSIVLMKYFLFDNLLSGFSRIPNLSHALTDSFVLSFSSVRTSSGLGLGRSVAQRTKIVHFLAC